MVDIYKWLFGERGKAAINDLAEDASGLLAPYLEDIAKTERPIIAMGFGDRIASPSIKSAVGGLPWWPAAETYPHDAKGNPLYLLMQINLAETPPLEPFPRSGLLQFFIAADDLYGCNLDDLRRPEGFRCAYHTDLKQPSLSDFSFLSREPKGYLPMEEPSQARALVFRVDRMPVDGTDYRFDKLLPEIAADDTLRDAYFDFVSPPALRLGGYPTFTQMDPRGYGVGKELGDFTLLTVDTTDGIMWGDSGVAQFFMHESDLKRRDFSKVVYNWDCC